MRAAGSRSAQPSINAIEAQNRESFAFVSKHGHGPIEAPRRILLLKSASISMAEGKFPQARRERRLMGLARSWAQTVCAGVRRTRGIWAFAIRSVPLSSSCLLGVSANSIRAVERSRNGLLIDGARA